jgi:hypothetical protein
MLTFAFLALTALGPDLPDAHRFGVCLAVARDNLIAAERHWQYVIGPMDEDRAKWAWEARQRQVTFAWNQLVTALDGAMPMKARQGALGRLRQTIGSEAWTECRMPSPIPDYTAWGR